MYNWGRLGAIMVEHEFPDLLYGYGITTVLQSYPLAYGSIYCGGNFLQIL